MPRKRPSPIWDQLAALGLIERAHEIIREGRCGRVTVATWLADADRFLAKIAAPPVGKVGRAARSAKTPRRAAK